MEIEFSNGEVRSFNLKPYLIFPIYEKLSDEAVCAKASVENGIVVWDEETDFDPDRLYLESDPLVALNASNMNNMN